MKVNLFRLTMRFPYGGNPVGEYYVTAKTKEAACNVWNAEHPENPRNYCAFDLVKKGVEHKEGIEYKKFNN